MTRNPPPPISSTDPGSWAQTTVLKRLPEIAQRVIDENQLTPAGVENISRLQAEIINGNIRFLQDDDGSDLAAWRKYIAPYQGLNWLKVPWFFAEHYFYRRIMEAVSYFTSREDPFSYQKTQGLVSNLEDIRHFAEAVEINLSKPISHERVLRDSLYLSLWGNQADLSLWPADGEISPKHTSQQLLKKHLLADQTKQIIKAITKPNNECSRVDIMLDNAGYELVSDLGLAIILLETGLTKEIILHLKKHPTFVSDVIEDDLQNTVKYLLASSSPAIVSLGRRVEGFISEGKILARADFFWNSPLAMWDLPRDLSDIFRKSSMLISKGDANYRRLLGDRQWDFTLPFHQVVNFLPVPLAALRTLKSELAVGLDLDQIQQIYNQDPKWLVNGKWGVIQFSQAAL